MNAHVTSTKSSRPAAVDLVVVGAGIIGCAIAAAAAGRGMSVAVIDAHTRPGFGSTSSSAGIVRVHALDIESSILADESERAWSSWREVTETPAGEAAASFVRCGSFLLDDAGDTLDRMAATMTSAAVRFDELDGDALAAELHGVDTRRFGPPALPETAGFWREPAERIERGLYTPASGYVADPALAAQNLAALAARRGATFVLGARVVGFPTAAGDRTTVMLDDGSGIEAQSVVNAAGPHSASVNRLAGVGGDFGVGLRIVRQELHLVPYPQGTVRAAHIVDGDLGINFRPEGDTGFLVGSNGAAVDGTEEIADPDEFLSEPTRDVWARHTTRIARRVPAAVVPHKPVGIAGLYDASEDWLPIYDRTDRPGFFVAIGTSGNQFKTAPVVGDLVVDIVRASLEGRDTDTDPVIVTLASGRTVDTGAFSRRRQPQTGGSRG